MELNPLAHLQDLIAQETARQEQVINLIASENYASNTVMQMTGSVLTNKYAEGYPGKRYYGGCQVIDQVEAYAITLAQQLFQAQHANVQPHSGSNANLAAYLACLQPGDTVLGMSLAAGGHLTHGHKVNFSGKWFTFIPYGVQPDTYLLDYDQILQLAQEHKPKLIVAGASAYARLIDYPRLATIAQEVGALLMVDMAHIAGLVAAKVIPGPVPHADIVTTTTHKTLRGPRGGMILSKSNLAAAIDKAIMPGSQGGPLMHVIAAKAASFGEALDPSFVTYQHMVMQNATRMAAELTTRGYKVLTGGTDTHLMLVDLYNSPVAGKRLTGKDAQEILQRCNIIINRNAIPFDTLSPNITSGMRLGTPALTTRGFGPAEITQTVDLIDQALTHHQDAQVLARIGKTVIDLCTAFPIYGQLVNTAPRTPAQDHASVSCL